MKAALATRPHTFIAIAGGTCAGKSTFADRIQHRATSHYSTQCTLISTDDFYPDSPHLSREALASVNWDSLRSLDIERLLDVLSRLLAGDTPAVPRYDRVRHRRLVAEHVVPGPLLVLEGLHAVTLLRLVVTLTEWKGTAVGVFIECPDEERFSRRLARETTAATIETDLAEAWHTTIQPVFYREITPQLSSADVVIQSPFTEDQVDRLCLMVLEPNKPLDGHETRPS